MRQTPGETRYTFLGLLISGAAWIRQRVPKFANQGSPQSLGVQGLQGVLSNTGMQCLLAKLTSATLAITEQKQLFTINPFASIIYLIKLVLHGLQPQAHKNTLTRQAFQGLRAHLPRAGQGSVLKIIFSLEYAGFEQLCPAELTLPCMADCSSLYKIYFFFLYCNNLSEHMAR